MVTRRKSRRFYGGTMLTIGFILSPLSWWNDLYVNVPISYSAAWLVSLLYKPAFVYAFIASYWITNLTGFMLMHKGAEKLVRADIREKYSSKRALIRNMIISSVYTLLILVLYRIDIIKPIDEYIELIR